MCAMPETPEIITADADRQIIEGRISGLSRRQVAERFGLSVAAVKAIEKRFSEDASDLEAERQIIAEQLSRIAHVFYSKAREGDVRSAQLCIELLARKSQLLGLDAPRLMRI